MKYICDRCEKYPCDDTEIKLMKYCPAYSPKPKPKSNADRIRAMTDEELAAKIEELCQYTFMQISVYAKPFGKAEWLDWLKQEAQCTSG